MMKVDLDPNFISCFVEHDKDDYLEITIQEDGTVLFYDTYSSGASYDGIPLDVEFTSEELIWLACKAKAFGIMRKIHKRSEI